MGLLASDAIRMAEEKSLQPGRTASRGTDDQERGRGDISRIGSILRVRVVGAGR